MKAWHDRCQSVVEIAEYLVVSDDDSIYRWIKDIGLPTYKDGRMWQFKKGKAVNRVRYGGAADGSK